LVEVFSNYNCGQVLHSQNVTTTNLPVSLGTITINTTNFVAALSGSVINCNGQPVTNGSIMMYYNGLFYRYQLSNTGTFAANLILCGTTSASITLIGEDETSGQQSTSTNYTINVGNNTIPQIQACGTTTNQFLNYSVNGTSYSYVRPTDSLTTSQGGANNQMIIYASRIPGTGGDAVLRFSTQNIGLGSLQNLQQFTSPQIPQNSSINAPINITITEYGAIGAFISGNFTGLITGPAPTNTPYNVTCSFRVRRTF
jgi:hypothetical protein